MEDSDKGNILSELLEINLVRKQIIKHIPSFSDMNNLVDVCKFVRCDFEKEKIERSMFLNSDSQDITITYKDEYDRASGVPGWSDLKFKKDSCSENRLNIVKTFFGETLLCGNRVEYFINLSIKKWKEKGRMSFIKKLVKELNLNCATRKDVKNLEFGFGKNIGYIVLYALNLMKHDSITRISLPVNCFTCPPYKYNMINGNIFNGFPNLTELSLIYPFHRSYYYDFIHHRDTFEKFAQQFSTVKNPTIIFNFLNHDDAMKTDGLFEIINILTKYNVKIKFNITIYCPRFDFNCGICKNLMGFCLPIKQYITTATSKILYHRQILHSIEIMETFENLCELHLKVILPLSNGNYMFSYNQKPGHMGLKKLSNLKNVKIEFSRGIYWQYSDIFNSFYPFFEIICSMMPRSVEVLQLIRVLDINDATAKMITKYMPNIKFLNIECLSYKESDGLDNFTKLECLTSFEYCPIKIPKTLKVLAFKHRKYPSRSDGLIFTDNLIKSHYEKFTKRITENGDNELRYILFNGIHHWHLFKSAIQEYFCPYYYL
uniref:F-box domain-containing protein n=1 Tax=Strongyloides papillosus TaxID=174720 RepID=A0A0N5BTI1_STREA